MWVDRYEKEQKDHTDVNTELLMAKSMVKDLELDCSNINIKLESQLKSYASLNESNEKMQNQLN